VNVSRATHNNPCCIWAAEIAAENAANSCDCGHFESDYVLYVSAVAADSPRTINKGKGVKNVKAGFLLGDLY
jgi:hypothetical protein